MIFCIMTLFLFSKILLFVSLCKYDNLPAYFFQPACFPGKLIEKRKRFLLPVNGMDSLYTLVIVSSYPAELLIESGELGVVFLRFLVNLHHLEFLTEDACEDKFGPVLHAGLFEHREELLVLPVIETEVIAVRARVCQHLRPVALRILVSSFIHENFKRFDLGEPPSPKDLSGRDFQRVEIFSTAESTPRYMLTHIKIRLGRIKSLKHLSYVLFRERAALSRRQR